MPWLTISEVLRRTGLPRSTFFHLRKHGRFPAPGRGRVTSKTAWRSEVIDRWMRDQREPAE